MKKINILDTENSFYETNSLSVFWRDTRDEELSNSISISKIIEENEDLLRSRYLSWIYDFGEMEIRGRRLVEHLTIRQDLSYWWMTLLAGKSNWALSPQIEDGIRLLAFTYWAESHSVEQVKLVSANEALACCLRNWCKKSDIHFDWEKTAKFKRRGSLLRLIYMTIPETIQAWIWFLKYVFGRLPLRGVGLNEWKKSNAHRTFITYTANCVSDLTQESCFESRYWSHLPDFLKSLSCQTNWLHLYVKDDVIQNAKCAAKAINGFNSAARGQQCHTTLDAFLSFRVIARTVRDWFFLLRAGMILKEEMERSSNLLPFDLWPLHRRDWQSSIYGKIAMNNLLYLNLFEEAIKSIPKQQKGVYLQENMAWEFGLIKAWRSAGHEGLIGMPHTTVRFWDLRYFFDPRSYTRNNETDLPLPDKIACNGPVALSAYEHGGYPKKDLVVVEALRYLHLGRAKPAMSSVSKKMNDPKRLLVLGDYLPRNTDLQMSLLEQAIKLMDKQLKIIVKPHPNYRINPSKYISLSLEISMEPIEKLLTQSDIAYTSSLTTAAVDAYCSGKPVISVLDPQTLNLSPLKECAGALFAKTPEELATALTFLTSDQYEPQRAPDYFTLGDDLSRWNKLLLCP